MNPIELLLFAAAYDLQRTASKDKWFALPEPVRHGVDCVIHVGMCHIRTQANLELRPILDALRHT